jgi:hypothetical protein
MIEMVLCGGRTDSIDACRSRAATVGLDVAAAGRQASRHFVVECGKRGGR